MLAFLWYTKYVRPLGFSFGEIGKSSVPNKPSFPSLGLNVQYVHYVDVECHFFVGTYLTVTLYVLQYVDTTIG